MMTTLAASTELMSSPIRVTLGGGEAIALGSESYGEVHWPCPDPALATIDQDPIGSGQKVGDRSAQCVFTGRSTLITISFRVLKYLNHNYCYLLSLHVILIIL